MRGVLRRLGPRPRHPPKTEREPTEQQHGEPARARQDMPQRDGRRAELADRRRKESEEIGHRASLSDSKADHKTKP